MQVPRHERASGKSNRNSGFWELLQARHPGNHKTVLNCVNFGHEYDSTRNRSWAVGGLEDEKAAPRCSCFSVLGRTRQQLAVHDGGGCVGWAWWRTGGEVGMHAYGCV